MKTYIAASRTGKGLSWSANKGTVSTADGRGTAEAKLPKLEMVLDLVLSPLRGLLYVVAFPLITLATVIELAWVKRHEKQLDLEKTHRKAVAVILSFIIGFFYVVGFPVIVIVALTKKLASKKRCNSYH